MSSLSLHSVRDRAGAGVLALLLLALGFPRAGAQEAKPATPPAAADAKDKDKDKDKTGDKEAPLPAGAHVAQSIQLDGKPLHYTVTVGTLPVYDNGKKTGEVVYTAYTVEGQDRPVTFALNGGPGAASVFLNFGAIGPKHLEFGVEGDSPSDPAKLTDNPGTWLDFTDLVFIDPIGTGYSRSLVAADESKKQFFSTDADIHYLSRMIYDWLVENGRMSSRKYFVGESYGGYRGPRITHYLQTQLGVAMNGVVLVSPYLNPAIQDNGDISPVPWMMTLPSITAAHLEREHKLTPEAMAPVIAYTRGEYATDLLKGRSDPEATPRIVKRVTAMTGLEEEFVRRAGGRLDIGAYLREVFRESGKIGSVYDSNVTGYDPFPFAPEQRINDPMLESIIAPTTTAMVDFVTRVVGWKTDARYNTLSHEVGSQWDRHRGDVASVLARTAREVEAAAQRGRVTPAVRTKFQAVALLLRDERARVRAAAGTDSRRAEQLKRLDGIATILATTAVRDAGLLALLAEDSGVSDAARSLKLEMVRDLGIEPAPEEIAPAETATAPAGTERRVAPQSVISRQLANPFLPPDFSAVPQRNSRPRRLASWELLGPLLSSFERADAGAPACMALPAPTARFTPAGLELMPHQGKLVAAAAAGHRTFLLADEPGLGKTAQALLAAEAANAYPLLVVVPNVVKTNWAREAARWTPRRPATVVQGDGGTVDGFADIVVLNYEVLDRHLGWLGDFGFRGMVVDEAHFIKNKTSQRSQHVLALSDRIRSRMARPLLMALTGTPLINDIEDFRAIWQFLGWIDDSKPLDELMDTLEDTGLTPADRGFYAAARQCVIDLGIVRRRKLDVAADIPARRIADLPVELDGPTGRSIRAAERDLADRMVARYQTALANRSSDAGDRKHRPRPHPPGGPVGAEGREDRAVRRERVHHDATHRPGEGRTGGGLRGAAGPQRWQGRLLRQAHRRDGRRRRDLRPEGGALLVDPRRPDAQGAAGERRRLRERPGRRGRGVFADRSWGGH